MDQSNRLQISLEIAMKRPQAHGAFQTMHVHLEFPNLQMPAPVYPVLLKYST
jgi:hypothetical protein